MCPLCKCKNNASITYGWVQLYNGPYTQKIKNKKETQRKVRDNLKFFKVFIYFNQVKDNRKEIKP